jgi:hypothetical protein
MDGGPETTGSGPEPPDAPARPARGLSKPRTWAIRLLLTLATILTVAGVLAIWANRQVLNADNWANTSTALLQNAAVRTQLSSYAVDQLYANVNVSGELRSALPPRLKPLAGPIAGGVRNLVQKVAFDLLGHPGVQAAWRTANALTARQFIDIVEGRSKVVLLNGSAVFLDLRPIVSQLTQRLGLPASLVQSLPPGAARLRIMSSSQIDLVRGVVNLVRGLAIIFPALALLLFALAVFLSARRRHALLTVGVDLLIAGLIALVARNVAGNAIVNALASTDGVKPAVKAVWSIATAMLSDIAQATIIASLAVLLAAALAGPRRVAVAFRRIAAPWFRERPGVAYTAVLALLLLIVLWGPIPATRMPIPVLIMIGLVWLGTEALRRQTALEFPNAQIGDTTAALRAGLGRWNAVRRRSSRAPSPPIAGGSRPLSESDQGDRLERLERLAALRDAGVLTEREFATEKAILLHGGDADR